MATRRRKKPVHKIFLICSSFTPDEEWARILKEYSLGKFPRGVRYEDGAIKCTRKKQTFVQHIPSDPEKALRTILDVFRGKLGIKTHAEKINDSKEFDTERSKLKIKSWKQASKGVTKRSLISNFAEEFAETNYLSDRECRNLILLLEVGISTKTIAPEQIVIDSGKITHIDGLRFDHYTRQMTIRGPVPVYEQEVRTLPVDYVEVPQINFMEGLNDYLVSQAIKQSKIKS